MVDPFSLSYNGSNPSTVKRENRKRVQFISSKHSEIFTGVAKIYKDIILTQDITGHVPIILLEAETKVRGRVL